ncbi:MAG: hypothetical protein ABI580_13450, partial [Burkholderiaceae bacterium]
MRVGNSNFGSLAAVALACNVIGTAVAASTVDASLVEQSKAFLRRYAELSATQSPELLDLYSDKATIRARAADRAGATTVVDGRSFKALMRESMLRGRAEADASNFHQGTVEQRGERLLIRARRYSANRCYWDDEYTVVLVREQSGWVILEETMATQMESRCSVTQLAAGSNGGRFGVAPLPGAAALTFMPGLGFRSGAPWSGQSSAASSAAAPASATSLMRTPFVPQAPAQIRAYRDPNLG